MGRAALDEETVRVLEDTHPAVDFDWPRILATRPQPSEPPPDPSSPAARAQARRDTRRGTRRSAPLAADTAGSRRADPDAVRIAIRGHAERARRRRRPSPLRSRSRLRLPKRLSSRSSNLKRRFESSRGSSTRQQPTSAVPSLGHRSSRRSKSAGCRSLLHPNARSAANSSSGCAAAMRPFMARISRRITDPALVERLRGIAERANPDGWVTDDEVKAGVAGLNAVYTELVPHVGRRRRRRRPGRRAAGGRRRSDHR